MKYTKGKKRYKDLQSRIFDFYFDLFLYGELKDGSRDDSIKINKVELDKFTKFLEKPLSEINELRENYIFEHSSTQSIKDLDKLFLGFNGWQKINEKRIIELFENFVVNLNLNEDVFLMVFGEDSSDRKCSYCGITEKRIDKLITGNKFKTKRLWQRGRSMEIDRKDPLKTYEKENITLCCYWCNNAKTDEFSEGEFQEIGKQFKKIWNARIREYNKTGSEIIKEIE